MLDLFAILTKGGLVLWCLEGTPFSTTLASVNALIKDVILQERGVSSHTCDTLRLHYKLDNEFELVFVVAYQKILQLSYIDRLLEQSYLVFRDRYKNELTQGTFNATFDFSAAFGVIHGQLEEEFRAQKMQPKAMRSFGETAKGKKAGKKEDTKMKGGGEVESLPLSFGENDAVAVEETGGEGEVEADGGEMNGAMEGNGEGEEEEAEGARTRSLPSKLVAKQIRGGRRVGGVKKGKPPVGASKPTSSPKAPVTRKKEDRKWVGQISKGDEKTLNYSKEGAEEGAQQVDMSVVGSMKGELAGLDTFSSNSTKQPSSSGGGGMFGFFKALSGGKTITMETLQPILEKMKEHLIAKNVAVDIAGQLCDSVAAKLNGKVIGTFTGVTSQVRSSMEESLVKILTPKRRVDILRDVMQSKEEQRPYVITFCGVNGVGKSTNLAKVCFWLLENNFRVMVAACDTFRSGAVEQLRTHVKHLSSLHPPKTAGGPPQVVLVEQGYGKDAAGIAMSAIHSARQQRIDVVLVDTAGRMQDNEPLMRALAKLIRVNVPDLVLFVGEALVGNEAVDQLSKFNRALADHSDAQDPRLIDGILLTKFDTIDDKVGAAISMTYVTGQPIVFVGTGQTYSDLKSLNVQSVVQALLN